MKALTFLLKPVSSACNMGCDYCFYADVSARRALPCAPRMTEPFLREMLGRIRLSLSDGDAVSFVFQGGEPTLAGLDFYRRFFEITGEWERWLRISYACRERPTTPSAETRRAPAPTAGFSTR